MAVIYHSKFDLGNMKDTKNQKGLSLLVGLQIVVLRVAGSSPVFRPNF